MKSVAEFISLVAQWDNKDLVSHITDPEVDGFALIINHTQKKTVIAYLNEDRFEEVDYKMDFSDAAAVYTNTRST